MAKKTMYNSFSNVIGKRKCSNATGLKHFFPVFIFLLSQSVCSHYAFQALRSFSSKVKGVRIKIDIFQRNITERELEHMFPLHLMSRAEINIHVFAVALQHVKLDTRDTRDRHASTTRKKKRRKNKIY